MYMTKFTLVENLVSEKMEPETTGCPGMTIVSKPLYGSSFPLIRKKDALGEIRGEGELPHIIRLSIPMSAPLQLERLAKKK